MGVMWYGVFYIGNILVFCGCHGLHKLKLQCFGVTDWDGSGDDPAETFTVNQVDEQTSIFSDF